MHIHAEKEISSGTSDAGRKTTREYWEEVRSAEPKLRLPSKWNVSVRDLLDLLSRYFNSGDRVLEIGFAPGKHLAYLAAKLGAKVSGLDYSEHGVTFARKLFSQLVIEGDLRCEDVFATTPQMQ